MSDIPVFFLEGYVTDHDLHAALSNFINEAGMVVVGPTERISNRQSCFIYFNLAFCQSIKAKQERIGSTAIIAAARAVHGSMHIDTSIDNLYITSDDQSATIGVYVVRLDFPEHLHPDIDSASISENIGNMILRELMEGKRS